MGWKVYADTYNSDGELGTKTARTKFNNNIILRTVRCWVVFFNNPPVTNLRMEIFSDTNNAKGSLLHTSTNVLTKAEMITLANGIKEIYFNFDDVQLDGVNWYHFVLNGVVSGLSASSTIAWKKAWPDPIYQTGLGLTFESLHENPYDCYFIGSLL